MIVNCEWNVGGQYPDYRGCGKPAPHVVHETQPVLYDVWLCDEHYAAHMVQKARINECPR
jgi:hypothetical protein